MVAFCRCLVVLVVLCLGQLPVSASACDAPAAVCGWTDRIVGIRTPNMIASGTVVADGFVVTNRHVAEDHARLMTRDSKGLIRTATPLPHDFPADLVILRLEGAVGTPSSLPEPAATRTEELFVVAFDQGRNGPRIYAAGDFAIYPAADAGSRARIHTNARALPGNSGGAVVDRDGRLVGILASGDGKISEVVPAAHIASVLQSTDPQHDREFLETGTAIRLCADALYESAAINRDPPEQLVAVIGTECLASNNRQLFDQAGQTFGRWWMFDRSKAFLQRSLNLDPQSPNTLMSMAVTLHLNRETQAERPILERYLAIDPANPQALRMAIQVAGVLQDREFADKVLEMMRVHNPAAVPLAESFITDAFGG